MDGRPSTVYVNEDIVRISPYDDKITRIELRKGETQENYAGSVTIHPDTGAVNTVAWLLTPDTFKGRSFNLRNSLTITFDGDPVPQGYRPDLSREILHTIEEQITLQVSLCYLPFMSTYAMEHLFMVRHGDHVNDGLTPKGEKEVSQLAGTIKNIARECRLLVISSPKHRARRAYDSAKIIADILSITSITEEESLYTCYETPSSEDFYSVKRFCDSQSGSIDGLVLVTHWPIIRGFSELMLKERLQSQDNVPWVSTGAGIHINLHNRKLTKLPYT